MSDSEAFGKILPNLKVTIDDEFSNSDNSLEAGEIAENEDKKGSDEIPKTEIIRKWMQTLHNPKVYSTKLGGFQTGLDLSSEVLIKKLEKRAERFGLDENSRSQITQQEIDMLYKSFGFDPANLSNSKNLRLGVIHMRGVNDMNTKEVSAYFKDYGPSAVEWINDTSCNVCWFDETSAARALLGVSQPFVIKRKSKKQDGTKDSSESSEVGRNVPDNDAVEMSESEGEETNEVKETFKEKESEQNNESEGDVEMEVDGDSDKDVKNLSLDIPVPPGCWRLGIPHPKAKAILLRFATKDDKKLPGAEKRSQYYMKYGNPNYGGLTGLISTSRKRKFQTARNRQVVEDITGNTEQTVKKESHYSSDSQKRSKVPRMKMYADEEEEKERKKRSQPAQEDRNPRSVKSRLGPRYTKDDLLQIGPKIEIDEDEELEGETLSVTCKIPSRYNIWSDQAKKMAQEEEELEDKRASKSRESSRYSVHTSERNRHTYNDYSGDLREALRKSSQRNRPQGRDLRLRINRLKEDKPKNHRSPLLRD